MEKYLLTYTLEPEQHPDGVEKKDIPEGKGACDAFVFLSLLYPEDGSFSLKLITLDGRKGGEFPVMDSDEVWKCWAVLASMLSRDKTLHTEKREFCDLIFETIRMLTIPDHPEANLIRRAMEEFRKRRREEKASVS
jgi:hypothetical protein